MIWIILGLLPIVLVLLWILFDDPEGFFISTGIITICALMSVSIVYGMDQMGWLNESQ